MKFEMRELRGDDLFVLLRIIGKLNIKDEFVAIYSSPEVIETKDQAEMDKVIEKRGMSIMANLLQTTMLNIGEAKDDLNAFLADLCGVKTNEIKELGLKDYTALIVSFFKKPELKDFFISIASFLR